jgi:hypothetical protein
MKFFKEKWCIVEAKFLEIVPFRTANIIEGPFFLGDGLFYVQLRSYTLEIKQTNNYLT